MSAHIYVSPAKTATIYAVLGDKRTALDLLEKAYEDRDTNLVWIKVDHNYDSLRSEPRFIELLEKVGLDKRRWRIWPPTRSTASRAQLNPKSDDLKRLRDDIDKELLSLAVS